MSAQDIRWIQRYNHFAQAFAQLEKAVALFEQRPLTELEEQGMIQTFEYTHELAWNVLKDFLEEQGLQNLYGSKDSTREAFKRGLVENGAIWMDMIKSRNLSPHTYNSDIAQSIVHAIVKNYYTEFRQLLDRLKPLIKGNYSGCHPQYVGHRVHAPTACCVPASQLIVKGCKTLQHIVHK